MKNKNIIRGENKMLNVMIIGGSDLEVVRAMVGTEKIEISHHFKYVNEAFDEILKNGERYLDVDVIVLLHYGFRVDDQISQTKDIQEAISVSMMSSKLYILLRDRDIYDKCLANVDDILIYGKTRILYISKLYNKTVVDIIEGRLDTKGIALREDESEELYDEEVESTEEGESKFNIATDDEDDSYGITARDKIKTPKPPKQEKEDNVTTDPEEKLDESYVGDVEKVKEPSEQTKKETEEGKETLPEETDAPPIAEQTSKPPKKPNIPKKPKAPKPLKEVTEAEAEKSKKGLLGIFRGSKDGRKDKEKKEVPKKPQKIKKPIPTEVKDRLSEIKVETNKSTRGVIAVTGDRKSGVTTVARNLAETYALGGNKVLLIDLDFNFKTLGTTYGEFNRAEQYFTNTQLGVYTALNNPDMLESVSVVVEDNLALLGLSRDNEFNITRFADKSISDLTTVNNILTLLGVAKGLYDTIILDLPLETLSQNMGIVLMLDEVLMCVENNLNSLDVLCNILISDLLDLDGVHTKSVLDKTKIFLTKYSVNSKFGGNELDEDYIQNMLRGHLHNRIQVVGRMTSTEVYFNQLDQDKSLIHLRPETRQEFISVVNSLL